MAFGIERDMMNVRVKGGHGEYPSFAEWQKAEGYYTQPIRFVALPNEDTSLDCRYRLDHLRDGISRIYKMDNVAQDKYSEPLPFEINILIVWPNSNYNDVIRLRFKNANARDNAFEWVVRLLNEIWEPFINEHGI
jgi:hypothetical protein